MKPSLNIHKTSVHILSTPLASMYFYHFFLSRNPEQYVSHSILRVFFISKVYCHFFFLGYGGWGGGGGWGLGVGRGTVDQIPSVPGELQDSLPEPDLHLTG